MKRLSLTIIGILLAVTLVTAVGLSNFADISLSKADYDRLNEVNSTEIFHTPIQCDTTGCDIVHIETSYGRTSWKPKPYWTNCTAFTTIQEETEDGLGVSHDICKTWTNHYYTSQELLDQLEVEKEKLVGRMLGRIKRDEETPSRDVKVEGGITDVIQG